MMERVLNKESTHDEVNHLVKSVYGRSAFIEGPIEKKESHYYSIGCSIPKFIVNRRESDSYIRYISLHDIDVVRIEPVEDRYRARFPERREIIHKTKVKEKNLLMQAEKSLLSCINKNIVQTSHVKHGLNPIIEIITGLLELNEIPVRDLRKQKRYLPLLQDLDYIRIVEDRIIPSNELNKFHLTDHSIFSEDERFYGLLGEITVRGYPYIKTNMQIMHLTPILRTSNVLFYSSLLHDERLPLSIPDVFSLYKRYYGFKSYNGDIKTLGYIRELSDVKVIEKQDDYLTPSVDHWRSFIETAPSIA